MARLTPEEWSREGRKAELAPVYLFYGEDALAIERAVEGVSARVLGEEGAEFNMEYFSAREASGAAVIGSARTLPMLSERRLVVVRRMEEFKPAERRILIQYLADVCPTTVLVLAGGGLSLRGSGRRKEDDELVKVAEKAGVVVEFPRPRPAQLPRLVVELVRERGKEIEPGAAELLIELAGAETLGLAHEVEKVCLYAGNKKRIRREEVIAAAADIREATIFEFTDAVARQETEAALRAFRRLREQGQEPIMILGMLARHFRLLWQLHALKEKGESSAAMARQVKVNEWILKKNYLPQLEIFPPREAGRVTHLLAELDMKLKSIRGDKDILFERTILALCRRGS